MAKDNQIRLAVMSGIFATAGGVLAKFAGFYGMDNMWSLALKLALLGAMVTSNTVGCTLHVKAMAGSGSSLPATVATSTVNYFCSAVLGALVFGEATSARWWCGTSLVLLGLLLIAYSPAPQRCKDEQLLEEEERKRQ